jgi:hypothetical protein
MHLEEGNLFFYLTYLGTWHFALHYIWAYRFATHYFGNLWFAIWITPSVHNYLVFWV